MKQLLRTRALRWLALLMLLGAPHPPAQAATLVVTSTADSGPGSLRTLLDSADPGDTITFDPAVFPPGSPATIFVRTAPALTLRDANLTIDASNAGVILDGSQAPSDTNGLLVEASGGTIRGLTIQNFSGGARNNSNGIFIAPGVSGTTVGGDRSQGAGPNGQGNRLVANRANGIEIWGSGNSVQGNYIGVNTAGNGPQGNLLSGVSIRNGAQNNTVGGLSAGLRNIISGNRNHGIYISDPGTSGNQVLGNFIGLDRDGDATIGQGFHGVMIRGGATNNNVGNGSAAGRNIISGNAHSGVRIENPATASNRVQGNYIGTNSAGAAELPNGLHGVDLRDGAHANLVGGPLPAQRNLLSGNLNHGLVITFGAYENIAQGNWIGPDISGNVALGNGAPGGVDIAEGADRNQIIGNVISGNVTDGIALFDNTGDGTDNNEIVGNLIGLAPDGTTPLPNKGYAVGVFSGVTGTRIEANQIGHNLSYGVWAGVPAPGAAIRGNTIRANTIHHNQQDGVRIETCDGNTVTQNSIYDNALKGIRSACPGTPRISGNVLGAGIDESIKGTTAPNATVEVFVDDFDEGKTFIGAATAGSDGTFIYTHTGQIPGANVTATSTDAAGNTSELSLPAHLQWTFLLYLNGDNTNENGENDLEQDLRETIDQLVISGPPRTANVLALFDRIEADTALYDLTHGATTITSGVELNMGSGQTLERFVAEGRTRYPARHTMLSIVDHGGGWAPSDGILIENGLPRGKPAYLAGSSGLSWDETSGYDHLDTLEIRETMEAIAAAGGPLDVVFFDVCLMGMIEVAYQLEGYADYFVSSQNIAWSPIGERGRYLLALQRLLPTTTPRELATLLVDAYADSMPPSGHPFSIAAVDLAQLPDVVTASDQLADALMVRLTNAQEAATFKEIYRQTQKVDYDADLRVEAATDGFVDLHHLASRVAESYSDTAVDGAASALMAQIDEAVVHERHRSGTPWRMPQTPEWYWDLENLHGLSAFVPAGEDLELQPPQGDPPAANVKLRATYIGSELRFVQETRWGALIDRYYTAVETPVPPGFTDGPVDPPLAPDVTPPRTTIVVSPTVAEGPAVTVSWSSLDEAVGTAEGSGVAEASLFRRLPSGDWVLVATQQGEAGGFSVPSVGRCDDLAVRAVDRAGNLEPVRQRLNAIIRCDLALPVIRG